MGKIDVIILSTGRSASTAIYKYLNEAARLNLPKNKEPHFLCDIYNYTGIYPLLNRLHIVNPGQYEKLYQNSNLRIDASVGYFFCIEEVVEKLQQIRQKPKIILLYREPLTRALSLYHVIKKKKLTRSKTLMEDIARDKPSGMWWEYYYDNVCYDKVYKIVSNYFDDVIAVNYDYFKCNQSDVVSNLISFIGCNDEKNYKMDYITPINSSTNARFRTRMGVFGNIPFVGRLIPTNFKHSIAQYFDNFKNKDNEVRINDLEEYLKVSIAEYTKFRKTIHHKDLLWLKK